MTAQGTFSDDGNDPLFTAFLPRPQIAIDLLGGFSLRLGGHPVEVGPTAARLIALLALRGPVSRSSAACTLWPQAQETTALPRLRTTIWRCRSVAPELITSRHDLIALCPDATVDCLGDAAPQSDLLPGWDDEWLVIERERQRQYRLAHLDALVRSLTREGALTQAMDVTLRMLEVEPLRESTHRLIIAIHLARRNDAEALRAYHRCARLLLRELGVQPCLETRQMLSALTPAPTRRNTTSGAHRAD